MDRQQFLNRVSNALGRSKPQAEPTPPPVVRDAVVRLVGPDDDVIGAFIANAEAVGLRVHRTTAGDAVEALAGLLGELDVQRLVAGSTFAGLDEAMRKTGVEAVPWRGDREMTEQYDVDAGLCDAEAAFADSGSIVVSGGETAGRGLYLVPPIHIAVLRAADVVPDQLDYMKALRDVSPGDLPAGRTFITGPSKTADIEGVLVTGVHGPGAAHILLID